MILSPENYFLYSNIFLVLLMLILLLLMYVYRYSDNETRYNLIYGFVGVAVIFAVNYIYNKSRLPI